MSAPQQFSNPELTPVFKTLFAALFIAAISLPSHSGTVVATPGSLSSYTYFPPVNTSTGGATNTGGEQDSLQRCLWAPSAGDKTVQVTDDYGYNKDVKFYYRVAGGNGGSGVNGGGGGSSAILKNGVPVVIAEGANGGTNSVEKTGFFYVKKNDILRFITGGGGGGGYWSATYSAGGGGGSGYMGGGGGASHSGANITSAPDAAGKGGTSAGGAGGTGAGMWSGTSGGFTTGGVSAPKGSTTPYGAYNAWNTVSYYNFTDWNYGTSYYTPPPMRHPAGAGSGSPMGDVSNYNQLGGAGGGLGLGGGGPANTSSTYGTFTGPDWTRTLANCSYGCYARFIGANMSKYPPHTQDMKLTRQIVWNNDYGSVETPFVGASLSGQIIGMYQAPTCEILK